MSFEVRTGPAAAQAAAAASARLIDGFTASALSAQDPTLWGAQATEHASRALGWVNAVLDARSLLPRVSALRERLLGEGVDRIVLAADGGIARSASLIAETEGASLLVLDSPAPEALRTAAEADAQTVSRTALVVAACDPVSAGVEAGLRGFRSAFSAHGLDPATRIIVVAAEGSALAEMATLLGVTWVHAPSDTDARFSALTPYALVPAGLAGADLEELLEEADATVLEVAIDSEQNPALSLAAAIAGAASIRPHIGLIADGTHLHGVAAWAEQLLAACVGCRGRGIHPYTLLPVSPEVERRPADLQLIRFVDDAFRHPLFERHEHDVLVSGSLGGQIVAWQHATALIAHLLDVDPFTPVPISPRLDETDRPALPAAGGPEQALRVTDPSGAATTDDVADALAALLDGVGAGGTVQIHAFADPATFTELSGLRELLAARVGRPVAFRWAPSYLDAPPVATEHSVLLQLVAHTGVDVDLGDDAPTAAQLIAAQAADDASAHRQRDIPVLTLTLTDAASGVLALFDAAQ